MSILALTDINAYNFTDSIPYVSIITMFFRKFSSLPTGIVREATCADLGQINKLRISAYSQAREFGLTNTKKVIANHIRDNE